MPDARHPADQAVTLPKKQRKSICILDEAVVGKISDGQHARSASAATPATKKAASATPSSTRSPKAPRTA